ncbi:HAD family hydrolase [Salsuginibacillus kocurii]|uniref:HAD family hydrolase n=1 Tax=Salsuginibacillus kocurii TaxID=427078 RepID=UPI00037522F6|nr:HAD family hydrolase [Salsuginibacillus kocurii]
MNSYLQINESSWEVEAVLFDKDGTLVDFPSLWVDWVKGIVADASNEETIQRVEGALGLSIKDRVVDPNGPLAIGSMAEVQTILAGALYETGWSWDVARQTVHIAVEDMEERESYMQGLRPLPGLHDFLLRLERKQIKRAVVTADDTAIAEKHLEALSLHSKFQAVIGADQVQRAKPEPDMLLKACEELGVAPENCLMIGDTNSDMKTGRSAGTKAAVGVVSYTLYDDHLCDADEIIHHYDEIQG